MHWCIVDSGCGLWFEFRVGHMCMWRFLHTCCNFLHCLSLHEGLLPESYANCLVLEFPSPVGLQRVSNMLEPPALCWCNLDFDWFQVGDVFGQGL